MPGNAVHDRLRRDVFGQGVPETRTAPHLLAERGNAVVCVLKIPSSVDHEASPRARRHGDRWTEADSPEQQNGAIAANSNAAPIAGMLCCTKGFASAAPNNVGSTCEIMTSSTARSASA